VAAAALGSPLAAAVLGFFRFLGSGAVSGEQQ